VQWIDLDSTCQETRRASEAAFKQELAWVSHLSLAAVLLPTPKPNACANYARCVNQVTQELNYVQAWVRIPLVHPVEEDNCDIDDTTTATNDDDNSGDSSSNSSCGDNSKQQSDDAHAMQVCSKLHQFV
jgi:PRMT5 TIM barrel domain